MCYVQKTIEIKQLGFNFLAAELTITEKAKCMKQLLKPEFRESYHCFINNQYIGIATYIDDPNIGPSFQQLIVEEGGQIVNEVLIPDYIVDLSK